MRGSRRSTHIDAAALAGVILVVAAVAVFVGGAATAQEQQQGYPMDPTTPRPEAETMVGPGIQVTLSIYSGRPNPSWQLRDGPELERLSALVSKLDLSQKALFDHDEWNRLGYASFWLNCQGIEGLPRMIHVWRDMAYVLVDGKDQVRYAIGATPLYDALVEQAERRDQREVFQAYHRLRGGKEPGR